MALDSELRVALITPSSFLDYSTGLSAGLSQRPRLSLDVHVLAPNGFERDERLESATWWPTPRLRDPRGLGVARSIARAVADADLVHIQATANPWIDATLTGWLDRPVVATIHDIEPHPGDPGAHPLAFAAIRHLATGADRVIVHASHVAAATNRLVGTDPTIIPHGELGSIYGAEATLSEPGPALFFGRAHGYKGLDVLVQAMEMFEGDEAELIVAGSGPSIDSLLNATSLPPSIRVMNGRVDADGVRSLFTEAAFVVLPYLEASQSGVAALAAGFGRPVIATDVGGLPELVEHDVTGLIVPPDDAPALADAVRRLSTDHDLRHRLGRAAFEVSSSGRLSWGHIAEQTEATYRQVVGDLL